MSRTINKELKEAIRQLKRMGTTEDDSEEERNEWRMMMDAINERKDDEYNYRICTTKANLKRIANGLYDVLFKYVPKGEIYNEDGSTKDKNLMSLLVLLEDIDCKVFNYSIFNERKEAARKSREKRNQTKD